MEEWETLLAAAERREAGQDGGPLLHPGLFPRVGSLMLTAMAANQHTAAREFSQGCTGYTHKGNGVARRTMGSRTESSVGNWKETWLPTLEALSLRERGILAE